MSVSQEVRYFGTVVKFKLDWGFIHDGANECQGRGCPDCVYVYHTGLNKGHVHTQQWGSREHVYVLVGDDVTYEVRIGEKGKPEAYDVRVVGSVRKV